MTTCWWRCNKIMCSHKRAGGEVAAAIDPTSEDQIEPPAGSTMQHIRDNQREGAAWLYEQQYHVSGDDHKWVGVQNQVNYHGRWRCVPMHTWWSVCGGCGIGCGGRGGLRRRLDRMLEVVVCGRSSGGTTPWGWIWTPEPCWFDLKTEKLESERWLLIKTILKKKKKNHINPF